MKLAQCIAPVLVGLILSHTPRSVAAEARQITFAEILETALDQSPVVREIEARVALERSEGIEAGILHNPELSGEVRPFVHGGEGLETEYEIELSQQLRLSDFGPRPRVARLAEEHASIGQQIKLIELEQGVRLAYGKAWALQERQSFLTGAQARVGRIAARVERPESAMLFPNSTSKLFSAERARLEAEQLGIAADWERAVAALVKFTGAPLDGLHLAALVDPPLPTDEEFGKVSDLPLAQRLRLRTALAREQRTVARLDSFPGFTPRVAFEHTESGDDRVIAGLSMELPFFDRNQAARLRTGAEERQRLAEIEYLNGGGLANEVQLLLSSVRSATAQAAKYRDRVIPALSQALDASESEIASGQSSPIQLWQQLLQLAEAHDRYLELWIKALGERAELAVLVGKQL